MAPMAGGKRKRGDRSFSGDGRDEGQRPSPHRPGNLSLSQHPPNFQNNQYHNPNYVQRGGQRRASRGGRGGSNQQSPVNSPHPSTFGPRQTNGSSNSSTHPTDIPKTHKPDVPSFVASNKDSINQEEAEQKTLPEVFSFFKHLPDEKLQALRESGWRQLVDSLGHHRLSVTLAELFDEIIRSVISNRMTSLEAGHLVKDIIDEHTMQNDAENTKEEISSLFLDCVSVTFETYNETNNLLPMLLETAIPSEMLRLELDVQLLEKLGLIRSTFGRVGIRQTTNLLYRQSNYNLLREETEGYSKLVTELFTMSSTDSGSGDDVQEAFERVKGMIGAFDLDVGRVLDITLDVFAAVLVKQNRFFVKYLRASSWWPQRRSTRAGPPSLGLGSLPQWALPDTNEIPPDVPDESSIDLAREERDRSFWTKAREVGIRAWFELGHSIPLSPTSVSDGEAQRKIGEQSSQADDSTGKSRIKEDEEWRDITGTEVPSGNDVAAQVLGFKLRFYSSTARDAHDVLPVNLVYLAALLIKIGFISLRDLYPHLWPEDDAMSELRKQKEKEREERERLSRPGGGTLNALAAAGALSDDTVPLPPRHRDTEKLRDSANQREGSAKPESLSEKNGDAKREDFSTLPEPSDQKVQLLKSLLCIGAIPESLFMLGRYPWLPDAFPELPEYIHRIAHYSLQEMMEKSRFSSQCTDMVISEKVVEDSSPAGKGQLKLSDPPSRRTMRWAQLDKSDTGDGIDYKFYWDDWANNVPICRSTNDVFTLCSTLLKFSGVKVGQDAELLTKLARIGVWSLSVENTLENRDRWIDLSKRLLVPAISLTRASPGAVAEVYELVKIFPINIRYAIYAEWFLGPTSRLPDIQSAFDLAKAETRDVLKRISKTTVKPMARALAKIALSSPGIVFQVAINQIESYNNLIETVVECARYFTYLGYDVLVWALLNALQGRGRDRTKSSGLTVSAWLSAIASFSGRVFRRYSIMNPTPMLRYVLDQLRRHNSTDLVILEELSTSMAGINSDLNLNESQILAMAGGELLRAQTLLQLGDKRHETTNSSKRLLRALVDPGLVGSLVILMAQERQTCIYNVSEDVADTKLLGNIYDEISRTLAQLLDLLRTNLTPSTFDEIVPSVDQLINDYQIDVSVAFWISRQSISASMQSREIETTPKKSHTQETKDGSEPTTNQPGATQTSTSLDTSMADAKSPSTDPPEPVHSATQEYKPPWHPVLEEISYKIEPCLPQETWNLIGRVFFITFWTFTLRDMNVPLSNYDDEIKRQNAKIDAINSDRTDISISGAQKKDQQKKALTDLQDRLRSEQKEHINAHSSTRGRLQKEKEYWFEGSLSKWKERNAMLLEHCFYPRIVMSPADSLYAYRFFRYLHSSGAKNFRTMDFLDQVFHDKRLMCLIASSSSKEAENLGRWFGEVLRDLGRWHADKSTYEREAYGPKRDLPGFAKKLEKGSIVEWFSYEDYRRVLYKWHVHLNIALKTCLASGDYMHERSAMNILKSVSSNFPVVNWMGSAQIACIERLTKQNERPDTKTAAMFILGPLKRKEADGWTLPQAFCTREHSAAAVTAAEGATPKPESAGHSGQQTTLNPQAPSFSPGESTDPLRTGQVDSAPQVSENNVRDQIDDKARKPSQGRIGVEDGEIEDEKMIDVARNSQDPNTSVAQQVRLAASSEDSNPQAYKPEGKVPTKPMTATVASASTKAESETPQDAIESTRHVDAKSTTTMEGRMAAPIPPRPEPSRNPSGRAAGAQSSGNLPSRIEPRSLRSDVPPTSNIPARPPREVADNRRSLDRAQEAIRERLNRNQTKQVSSSTAQPDYQGIVHHASLDRRHGRLTDENEIRDPMVPTSQNERPYASRDRQPHEESPGNRRSDKSYMPHPPPNAISPQASIRGVANPQDTNKGRGDFNQSRGYGSAALHEGPMYSDSAGTLDRHGQTASQSQYNTFRHRDGGGPNREDYRHPSDQYSAQGGRHYPQPPQEGRLDQRNHLSQIDGSRDYRNGSLDSENRFQARLPEPPRNHPSRQDPQYGRLNNNIDTPAGPRTGPNDQPSGRPTRNSNITQSHAGSTSATSQRPGNTPSGGNNPQTPKGPSHGRSTTRNGVAPPHPGAISTQVPPASDAPDTAGVHPDRLKAIQALSASPTEPSHQRVNNQVHAPKSAVQPSQAAGPPRGPASQAYSPTSTAQNGFGVPNGPSNGVNRGDKRFAGIQGVLQQSGAAPTPDNNGQGTSIRGRGARNRNASEPSASNPGALPPVPRAEVSARENTLAGRISERVPVDEQSYGHGRRRADVRDAFKEINPGIDGQRNRSPTGDQSYRMPPRDGEGRPYHRNDRQQDVAQRPPTHELRRSARNADDRRMPPERRDGGSWSDPRGAVPPERYDERDRREGGGSMRKRFRPGDEMMPERARNHGDKRPRRMQ